MSDIERAAAICLDYYASRNRVRQTLSGFIGAGLRAQSFDGGSSSATTITFCWKHQRSVEECGRAFVDGAVGEQCVGEPIPTTSDRTGDAALSRDPWRSMLEGCERWELRLAASVGQMLRLPHPATGSQVVQVLRLDPPSETKPAAVAFGLALQATAPPKEAPAGYASDGRPGCGSCQRLKVDGHPLFTEPTYNKGNPTDLSGELRRKVRLCDPCFRFAIAQHPTRLPSVEELRHRNNHPRGHWPKQYAKPGTKAS